MRSWTEHLAASSKTDIAAASWNIWPFLIMSSLYVAFFGGKTRFTDSFRNLSRDKNLELRNSACEILMCLSARPRCWRNVAGALDAKGAFHQPAFPKLAYRKHMTKAFFFPPGVVVFCFFWIKFYRHADINCHKLYVSICMQVCFGMMLLEDEV